MISPSLCRLACLTSFGGRGCHHIRATYGFRHRHRPVRTPLGIVLHRACTIVHYVDESTAALASVIGARVRQERLSRNWTLDHLADVAAVSRRMLVNVEQGVTNPSVGTLLRLSDALGIGLPAMVEPPKPAALKVTRNGEGVALWSSDAGGRGLLVAGTEPPDVVELWDWTLMPGDRHTSDAHSAGTRELIQVRDGSVTVVVAGEAVVLEPGDALAFSGAVAHSYANTGPAPARFSLAVFQPNVGSDREENRHG
jgi:transcriptional regulator with XRE-family HTH domain